jgi:alcohol oxidase
LTSHHPHFHPASPAAAKDIDIDTALKILPDSFTTVGRIFLYVSRVFNSDADPDPFGQGIHMGTWHKPGDRYDPKKVHKNIEYTKEDDEAIG